jgi:hypothetical protein
LSRVADIVQPPLAWVRRQEADDILALATSMLEAGCGLCGVEQGDILADQAPDQCRDGTEHGRREGLVCAQSGPPEMTR